MEAAWDCASLHAVSVWSEFVSIRCPSDLFVFCVINCVSIHVVHHLLRENDTIHIVWCTVRNIRTGPWWTYLHRNYRMLFIYLMNLSHAILFRMISCQRTTPSECMGRHSIWCEQRQPIWFWKYREYHCYSFTVSIPRTIRFGWNVCTLWCCAIIGITEIPIWQQRSPVFGSNESNSLWFSWSGLPKYIDSKMETTKKAIVSGFGWLQ